MDRVVGKFNQLKLATTKEKIIFTSELIGESKAIVQAHKVIKSSLIIEGNKARNIGKVTLLFKDTLVDEIGRNGDFKIVFNDFMKGNRLFFAEITTGPGKELELVKVHTDQTQVIGLGIVTMTL